jgi:hypothetical protein
MKKNVDRDLHVLIGIACVACGVLILVVCIPGTRTTLLNTVGKTKIFIVGYLTGVPTVLAALSYVVNGLFPHRSSETRAGTARRTDAPKARRWPDCQCPAAEIESCAYCQDLVTAG